MHITCQQLQYNAFILCEHSKTVENSWFFRKTGLTFPLLSQATEPPTCSHYSLRLFWIRSLACSCIKDKLSIEKKVKWENECFLFAQFCEVGPGTPQTLELTSPIVTELYALPDVIFVFLQCRSIKFLNTYNYIHHYQIAEGNYWDNCKENRKKRNIIYKGVTITLVADFFITMTQVRRQWNSIFNTLSKKITQKFIIQK